MVPETGAPRRELPEYVIIGRVTRPHGVKGAVRVAPMTDDPQRFRLLTRLYINFGNNNRSVYTPIHIQVGNGYVIIQFNGITSRDEAEKLRNCDLEIPRQECIPLPEGKYYFFELIGLSVQTNENILIGQLTDIISYPAGDLYVVKKGQKEILIPAVEEFIKKVDMKAGIITINPIEGLLD